MEAWALRGLGRTGAALAVVAAGAGIGGAATEGSRSVEGAVGIADSVNVNVRPSTPGLTHPIAVFSDGLGATVAAAAADAGCVDAGCGV